MTETRKLAAILAGDIVGFSRLAGADEDWTLASLRALRNDLIDPTIAAHKGRVVKRTGDGFIVEFRSVVDAVRCALEIQRAMVERNAGAPEDRRIEFRMGVHLGDVVEESDGDLMGDGVNIAARIEGVAEAGGVCLSGAAHEQVRDKVKEPFVDLGERSLKNIARSVRIFALKRAAAGGIETRAEAPKRSGAPRLSIVVLPFANIGGDLEHEAFVDGVTESLTTDLSRMSGMLVIGRNTAFTYKGKAVDLKQIGRELNVRYLLEGSVQRAGGRMRMNVQLVEAESGNHLWAERFDKPLADLFDMQDEIVARLANTLNTQLVAAEARRAAHAPNPDSIDLYFQGMARLNKGVATGNVADAHGFFERALTLDPGNVEAMVGSAIADVFVAAAFVDDAGGALVARTEAALIKALDSGARPRRRSAIKEAKAIATIGRGRRASSNCCIATIGNGFDPNFAAHSLINEPKSPKPRSAKGCALTGLAPPRTTSARSCVSSRTLPSGNVADTNPLNMLRRSSSAALMKAFSVV